MFDADRIRDIFQDQFSAANFITQTILRYGQQGRYIYELSTGTFMKIRLYGVTVLKLNEAEIIRNFDFNKSFDSLEEAEAHIRQLGEQDHEPTSDAPHV